MISGKRRVRRPTNGGDNHVWQIDVRHGDGDLSRVEAFAECIHSRDEIIVRATVRDGRICVGRRPDSFGHSAGHGRVRSAAGARALYVVSRRIQRCVGPLQERSGISGRTGQPRRRSGDCGRCSEIIAHPKADRFEVERGPAGRISDLEERTANHIWVLAKLAVEPIQPALVIGGGAARLPARGGRRAELIDAAFAQDERHVGEVGI